MPWSGFRLWLLLSLALAGAWTHVPPSASAQPADASQDRSAAAAEPTTSEMPDGTGDDASTVPEPTQVRAAPVDVPAVLRGASQLRALLSGTLALDVDAESLLRFDAADLPPEVARGLEAVLAGESPRKLLRELLPPPPEPPRPRRRRRAPTKEVAPPPLPDLALDEELPPQRQLLAAYLRWLSLPADQRSQLLDEHAARRSEAQAAARAQEQVDAALKRLARQRDALRSLLTDSLPLDQKVEPLLQLDLQSLRPARLPEDTPKREMLQQARAEVAELRKQLLSLSLAERRALVTAHAQRRAVESQVRVEQSKQAEAAVASAEHDALQAAEARERALEVAERARTEAQRLVAAERARLLLIRERQANFAGELQTQRKALGEGRERVLEWHRRVQELAGRSVLDPPRAPDADQMFPLLFDDLHRVLGQMGDALERLADGDSQVPEANLKVDLPANLDTSGLAELRREVADADRELRSQELLLHWERAEAMREDVQTLNRARLRLLAWMSARMRGHYLGFGPDGMRQARIELEQITQELHYQALHYPRLVETLERQLGAAPMPLLFALLQCVMVVAAFRFWRRVGPRVLGNLRRKALSTSPPTSLSVRIASAAWYAQRVRGPLEALVLLWLLTGIVGTVTTLPGLDYLWLVTAWGLTGSAVVLIVDALAARQQLRIGNDPTAHLRIRSLRLVGILVVGAGLILSLFERSVGQGTIYSWVVQACWTGSVPALMLLLHWWRPVVLERICARPDTDGVIGWIRNHKNGWKSYTAAALGGAILIGSGVGRTVLDYASEWEGTQRALAYMFRSEVARQARARPRHVGQPLDSARAPSLHPDALRSSVVEEVGRAQFERLVAGVEESRCTLAVVAGERGAGKSVLLRRLAEKFDDQALLLRCPPGGLDELNSELARLLDLGTDASDDAIVSALQRRAPKLVLIDDVHRLVLPAIGGLVQLDRLVSIARRVGDETSWVLAIGQPAWAYVDRARHERIAFDQVVTLPQWSERQIGQLLRLVNTHAELRPSFEGLVVPRQIDEPEEDGDRAELGYFRILWDYSGGNPGVALYWWRRSLYEQPDGSVEVQLFDAPDAWDMETVPLNVRFVLRAILQLDQALPSDIAECLELPESSIEEALYYATARGYTERVGPRYTVTWHWYRCIVTALRRQKLITG